MTWSIYVLKHPITNEVRYVGFTSRPVKERLARHLGNAALRDKTYKGRWVLSLISMGLRPVIEVIESGIGDGWQEAERRWIAFHRANGGRLVNTTDGGDSLPASTSAERSERAKKWHASRTPEERSASAARIHARMTPEQRQERAIRMANYSRSRTRDDRLIATQKRLASTTPEQRSAVMTKRWADMAAEEKVARGQAFRDLQSNEFRVANGKKLMATWTHEQRIAWCKEVHASRTPEERSTIVKNGRVTRALYDERHPKTPEVLAAQAAQRTECQALGSKASAAKWRSVTHCKRGHEHTDENTYTYANGRRKCRQCNRDGERNRRRMPKVMIS